MKSHDDIKRIAKSMIDNDKNLNMLQEKYEGHSRLTWSLPSPLNRFEWVRPIKSTGPYDAIRGAVRVLSNLRERVNIEPISVLRAVDGEDDKSAAARKKANEWEKTLLWTMEKASKRQAGFRDSVIWNAVVYDEIVAQLIYLPNEFKARGLDSARESAALRLGDWAIRLCDPKQVHIEYSEYMPERVLKVTKKTAQQIVDYWGDAAKKIRGKIKNKPEHRDVEYFEFDYVDYDARCVWVVESSHDSASTAAEIESGDFIMFGPEPWLMIDGKPVPFLPWVAVVGGTVTDELPEYRRKPLLFGVIQAELWASANIQSTLVLSQAVSEFGMPRQVLSSPTGQDIDVDFGEPGGMITITPFQAYERIQQLGLDPQLRESYDRVEAAIAKATVAEILVTGQPMGGVEAFAAYNLQLQSAIASLGAHRNLGQRFYERLYEMVLLIVHYSGGSIEAYGEKLNKYVIDSEEIDPETIHLTVELSPDVPADRVQRVQAAVAMSQQLEYPTRKILEFLGENDPDGAIEEYWKEQINRADMMGRIERIRAGYQMEIQQAQMAMAMQAQAQAQAIQPPVARGPAGVGQGRPEAPMKGTPMSGQEWNPAQGMPPPATASPSGNTREFQRGLTRTNVPIAEVS